MGWKTKRWTEYEVRALDANGDAFDVNGYDTFMQARREFLRDTDGAVAYTLERCRGRARVLFTDDGTDWLTTEDETRDYEVLLTRGDARALAAWGGH